jgi:hypothetical protein
MEVSYVCSLGQLCHTGMLMKRNKLKLASYPFDWIFSNFKNIIHCIEDDFKIFLDKSYYFTVCPSLAGHRLYDTSRHMFNHHDPLVNENEYQYFIRCVDRFRALLKYDKHKLFITIVPNLKEITNDTIDEIIEFNTKFTNHTTNYTLLYILHLPNKTEQFNKFTTINCIDILELHTLNESDGQSFRNDVDDIYLDTILNSRYLFNLVDIQKHAVKIDNPESNIE